MSILDRLKAAPKKSKKEFMGIVTLTPQGHVLLANGEELIFYRIRPTNINVLSRSKREQKIRSLSGALKTICPIEFCAMDSIERFDANREYLKNLMEKEENPCLKELDRLDAEYLEKIQNTMATARDFFVILRCRQQEDENRKEDLCIKAEHIMAENGFDLSLLDKKAMQEILRIYLQREPMDWGDPENLQYPAKEQKKKRVKPLPPETEEEQRMQNFLESVMPGIINFGENPDYYIFDNTYRCVWAIRSYPSATEETALLASLGEMEGVTIRIYLKELPAKDENRIIDQALNKSSAEMTGSTSTLREKAQASFHAKEVAEVIKKMAEDKENLLYCTVYLEIIADSKEELLRRTDKVYNKCRRQKINVDKLWCRQQDGFLSISPFGKESFDGQYDRVLPASSAANLYPFSYSGMTNAHGMRIGKDRFGSQIIVDFEERTKDKTNGNALILGNSGEGKSFLLKLIVTILRQQGKRVLILDPDNEFRTLVESLNGSYIDIMQGKYFINVLEPKQWTESQDVTPEDAEAVRATFTKSTVLSQHISFLRDFFRCYKALEREQLDTLEIMLELLYRKFHITSDTDIQQLRPEDFPILSDLYTLMESELEHYSEGRIYRKEHLQTLMLALHSICKGADSQFFNGHTNIPAQDFVAWGVRDLLNCSQNLKDAMLFNILSYMSDKLLKEGNTAAVVDELHVFLTNLTTILYMNSFEKRVRKKDSIVILASQNIEDFNAPEVREYTRPLFSIPTHQFMFYPGTVTEKAYLENVNMEESEFALIRSAQMGRCLYKCGNDRYLLQVSAPEYKSKLFGKEGGRGAGESA